MFIILIRVIVRTRWSIVRMHLFIVSARERENQRHPKPTDSKSKLWPSKVVLNQESCVHISVRHLRNKSWYIVSPHSRQLIFES